MTLSLIICTYRRPASVVALLESLRQQTHPPDEVLVVDGSPDDATALAVARFCADTGEARVRYLPVPPEQRGLTRQRNWGLDRATGAVIAFLDDDVLLEPAYFAELLRVLDAQPAAVGVGGYITNLVTSWQAPAAAAAATANAPREAVAGNGVRDGMYHWHGWRRPLDLRWRLRARLGLLPATPPGWLPPDGHGWSVNWYPPDGQAYRVEYLMGGASAWRAELFQRQRFSPYFEGYGLYEDLEFCIRAAREGELHLCTSARLSHHEAPAGRPRHFRYGMMVVRNGWHVWRQRWPRPSRRARLRWWLISLLLAACRAGNALSRRPLPPVQETLGRLCGMLGLLGGRAPGSP
jgi:glycosyltransferase involved in cell wall biosynthesis